MTLILTRSASLPRSRPGRWWPSLAASAVWLLVGLTAVYWASRWSGAGPQEAVPVSPAQTLTIDSAQVARALGAGSAQKPEAVPAASSRHVLLGVATDRAGHGVALIGTDGQPPKAYRVGAALPDGTMVRSLGPRQVELSAGSGSLIRLELSLPSDR